MTCADYALRERIAAGIRRRLREEISILERCNTVPAPVPAEKMCSLAVPTAKAKFNPGFLSWLARLFKL